MKIEALTRLTSVRIVPQSKAFPDASGISSLQTYKTRATNYKNLNRKIVKTNISGFTIEVDKLGIMYDIFLVKDGAAVGLLSLFPARIMHARGLWTSSSYFLKAYRGLGYAKALYMWVLNNNMSLLSDIVQSKYSSMLWQKLAQSYDVLAVQCYDLRIKIIDVEPLDYTNSPGYRLLLLARGLSTAQFIKENKLKLR